MRLVRVHRDILSSYQPRSIGGGTGGPRETLLPLYRLGDAGRLESSCAASLLRVHRACMVEGIDLRITDAWRGETAQTWARVSYESGRGPFALHWGESWHGAGCAVDVDVKALGDDYDRLGELMRAEGWEQVRPGLRPGDEEAWHWQRPPGMTVQEAHEALGLL